MVVTPTKATPTKATPTKARKLSYKSPQNMGKSPLKAKNVSPYKMMSLKDAFEKKQVHSATSVQVYQAHQENIDNMSGDAWSPSTSSVANGSTSRPHISVKFATDGAPSARTGSSLKPTSEVTAAPLASSSSTRRVPPSPPPTTTITTSSITPARPSEVAASGAAPSSSSVTTSALQGSDGGCPTGATTAVPAPSTARKLAYETTLEIPIKPQAKLVTKATIITPSKLAKEAEKEKRRLEREAQREARETEKTLKAAEKAAREALREAQRQQRETERREKEAAKEQVRLQREKEKQDRESEKETVRIKREMEKLERDTQKEMVKEQREKEKKRLLDLQKAKEHAELSKKKKHEKHANTFKSFFNAQPTKKKAVDEKAEACKKEETLFQKTFPPFFLAAHTRRAPLSYIKDEATRGQRVRGVEQVLRAQEVGQEGGWQSLAVGDVVAEMRREQDSFRPSIAVRGQPRLKLFFFAYQRRPPFYGSFQKKSNSLRGRAPFNKDNTLFDYEVDSDDDWEDEGEGEDCSDADDEEEKAAKGGESADEDDGFVVPHGYLSDDEMQGGGEDRDSDDGDGDGDGDGAESHVMDEDASDIGGALCKKALRRKRRLMEKEEQLRCSRPLKRLVPVVIGMCYANDSQPEKLHPEHMELRDACAAIPYGDGECLPVSFTAADAEDDDALDTPTSSLRKSDKKRKKTLLVPWVEEELVKFVRVNRGGIQKLVNAFVKIMADKIDRQSVSGGMAFTIPTKAAVERWMREYRAHNNEDGTQDVSTPGVTPLKTPGSGRGAPPMTPASAATPTVAKAGGSKRPFKTVVGQKSLLDALNHCKESELRATEKKPSASGAVSPATTPTTTAATAGMDMPTTIRQDFTGARAVVPMPRSRSCDAQEVIDLVDDENDGVIPATHGMSPKPDPGGKEMLMLG